MTKPSLLQGILMACLLSVLSIPLLMVLTLLGWGMANQIFIATLAGGYIAFIVARSRSRVGRVTLGAISLTVLFGACLLGASTLVMLCLAVGCIWLVRTLLNYTSIAPALMDGLLCGVSAVCALAVLLSTGKVVLTVWSFFLLQALCSYIPRRLKRAGIGSPTGRPASGPPSQPDPFTRAYRAAEDAIRGMAQHTAG